MKEIVYLIGQISVDAPETYKWRKNLRRIFAKNDNFEMVDPCNNGFNQEVLKMQGLDPDRKKVYKTQGINLLVPKDKSFVMRSTMAVANMNTYDPEKAFIGTIFELAWYHDFPEKTVIGIYDGDWTKDLNCMHPFVQEAVHTWVRDEYEAAKLMQHYFQDVFVDEPTFEENRLMQEFMIKNKGVITGKQLEVEEVIETEIASGDRK